ncbi:MAG: hypothetical protein LBL99_02460 [Holosporaceae bacterium]|jgi:hypothetical protein|nr:hypothetical protein [Holosporaceae bacterium]
MLAKKLEAAETRRRPHFNALFRLITIAALFISVCFFSGSAADLNGFSEALEYEEALKASNRSEIELLKISKADKPMDLSVFSNLKKLRVSFCKDARFIKNIPETLEVLDIEDSAGVCLRDINRNCPRLKVLAVRQCENASVTGKTPDSLEELLIEVCEKLTLSVAFLQVKKLTIIDTTFTNQVRLNLADFRKLEEARFYGCEKLFLSGNFPVSLQKLHIINNGMIPFAINLTDCVNLEELSVSQEINSVDFGKKSGLKSLQVHDSESFELVGELPRSLEYVDFFQVNFAEKVEVDLRVFANLKNIDVSDCENFSLVQENELKKEPTQNGRGFKAVM